MPDDLKNELSGPFSFSQSSLQDYLDCPRRFQLRYIEHLAWPAVEVEPVLENERRQEEGQLFHRMIQQHLVGLPVEKLSRQASPPNLSRWWKNYIDYDLKINGYTLYPELTISAPIGKNRLVAKYDLLAILPGQKAIIFDWKTTHRRPRDEWMAARMQTRVYQALLVRAGATWNGNIPIQPVQVEMIYWFADYPSEPAHFPYSLVQNERDWKVLTELVNDIIHHRYFPLTEDEKKCVYCPFRSYCNRGIKAGILGEADEEVEDNPTELNLNFEQIAEIEF